MSENVLVWLFGIVVSCILYLFVNKANKKELEDTKSKLSKLEEYLFTKVPTKEDLRELIINLKNDTNCKFQEIKEELKEIKAIHSSRRK